jgi:hypothetical protein
MRRVLILLGLLAVALLPAGCGGKGGAEKGAQGGRHSGGERPKGPLYIKTTTDPYNGPAPLKIEFTAKAHNAVGDVAYIWRFDDGTTSRKQNPTHVFREPGYYQVIMIGEDEKGHSDSWNIIVAAWPPKYIKPGTSRRERAKLLQDAGQATRERRKKYPLRPPPLPRQLPPASKR